MAELLARQWLVRLPIGSFRCFLCQHRGYLGATNALSQLSRNHAMATQAEGTNIIQVALAAPFGYRQNVIRIPKTLAHPCGESPVPHEREAEVAACSL
jgi:hypothetical protein